jgi:hypothetical protein
MKWSVSELESMFSSAARRRSVYLAWAIAAAVCLVLILIWLGRGREDGGPPGGRTEVSRSTDMAFRSEWTELELARAEGPYLVLDLGQRRISLRVKGVLLWSCPIGYDRPDSEVAADLEPFLYDAGQAPVAMLTGRHLFTAKKVFPDSVLAVVARVARVRPEQLQRYQPGDCELRCGCSLVIHIRTDADAEPLSRLGNLFARVRGALLAPLVSARIPISMRPEDALTLYGAARPHTPVLIHGETGRPK